MSAAASYWRNAVRHPEDCGIGNIRRTMDYSEFGEDLKLPIGCLEAGAVPLRISTYVQTAVTGGTPAVTIGTAATPAAFALATDIAVGTTGYKKAATGAEMGVALAVDTIFYAYLSTGALTGKFTVTVEFANNREAAPEIEEDAGDGEEGGLEELAFADFVNGVYRIGGATVAVEDMFVHNSNFGAFDPEINIYPEGLRGAPVLESSLAADFLASGFTVVGSFIGDGVSGQAGFSVVDLPDYNYSTEARLYYDNATPQTEHSVAVAEGGEVQVPAVTGDGPFTFAVTFTASGQSVAASINGAAIFKDTTATSMILTDVTVYASVCYIQTLTYHPPQPDADLPGLSTP